MQSFAWKEVLRVVVFVRWKDFTGEFSSFVWKSSNVERETRQVVQTRERAWQTVFDNTFNKSSNVQEGEFVFFEINKFKSLGYSFTTDGRGGFVRWRQDKLNWLSSQKHWKGRSQLLQKTRKNLIPLPACASESKIKRSRLKTISRSNVFIMYFLLTAHRFWSCRSLANKCNGKIPNDAFLKRQKLKRCQLLLTYMRVAVIQLMISNNLTWQLYLI